MIGDWLALDHPEAIIGLHEIMVAFRNTGAEYGSGEIKLPDVTEEERAFAREEGERFKRESAYFMLHATRPGTIAPAFADSPAALLAWMGEKYYRWTDQRARAFDKIVPLDRLLTEISLYWLTDSAATAIWPYAGFAQEPFSIPAGRTITAPVAVMLSPDPLQPPAPRHLAERSRSHLIRWTNLDHGGHFPMLEIPDALIRDVRAFARATRRLERWRLGARPRHNSLGHQQERWEAGSSLEHTAAVVIYQSAASSPFAAIVRRCAPRIPIPVRPPAHPATLRADGTRVRSVHFFRVGQRSKCAARERTDLTAGATTPTASLVLWRNS